MSGHSKWNTIKRSKGKADAVRGKLFTKIGREIAVIVKSGGADPNTNPRLKDAITKAKQNNMPNDTIERSIKKASGELSGVNYESCVYEGYGIGGAAVIVECLTDNKNRTAGDVRHAFDKNGGSLGATGCVSYLFERKGIIEIIREPGIDSDELMLACLDAGAKDMVEYDDYIEIYTESTTLQSVCDNLEKSGYKIANSQNALVANSDVDLEEEKMTKFIKMVDMLEDLDDVQQVYHNVNLPEEIDEE